MRKVNSKREEANEDEEPEDLILSENNGILKKDITRSKANNNFKGKIYDEY